MNDFLYLRLHMNNGKTHNVAVKILDDSSAEQVWNILNEEINKTSYIANDTFWVRTADISFIEPHVANCGQ